MPVKPTMRPSRARRKRAAKSAELGSRRPWPVRRTPVAPTEAVVVIKAMRFLVCLRQSGIRLHHVIARLARNAIFVGTIVNHRHVPAEIVVRRRSRRSPLKSCRFPRIITGFLAELHAPEEIEQEDELAGYRNEGSVRHECL